MSETAKPKARKRAEPANSAAAVPARKPRARRAAAAPEALTASPETVSAAPAEPKPKPTRKRASAPARTDIRAQAIAAFTAAQPDAERVQVQKIRSRREIVISARIGGAPTQMRWSYADGTLNPIAA